MSRMIPLAGIAVDALSVGGLETCIQIPGWDLAFDIGRCPPSVVSRSHVLFTHAHMDHFRHGCGEYIFSRSSVELMRLRLRGSPKVTGLEFGEQVELGDVKVSFHPAGHILGSCVVELWLTEVKELVNKDTASQGALSAILGHFKLALG